MEPNKLCIRTHSKEHFFYFYFFKNKARKRKRGEEKKRKRQIKDGIFCMLMTDALSNFKVSTI